MRLNSYQGYSANVGFLKFVAACMVICSHAFPLSMGNEEREWFHVISAGKVTMGSVAVGVFFFYSGLLVMKSLTGNSNAKHYFGNRVKRIVPPLAVVVFCCTFLLGPIVTSLSVKEYFTSAGTYRYLLNSVMVLVHDLPGVFESNIYQPTVNGALWTLPVEFLCYIGLFLAHKLRLTKRVPMAVLSILLIVVTCGMSIVQARVDLGLLGSAFFPMAMFWMGMAYYIFRDHIPMDGRLCIGAVALVVVADLIQVLVCGKATTGSAFAGAHVLLIGLVIGLPYVLAYVGFAMGSIAGKIGGLGKISYGMYLVAFPIQQTLVYACGGAMNVYANMIVAVALAILGGAAIYWGVERKI